MSAHIWNNTVKYKYNRAQNMSLGAAHALWVVSNPAFGLRVQHGLGRPLPEREPESPELNLQTTVTTATDVRKYPQPPTTSTALGPVTPTAAPTQTNIPPPSNLSAHFPPRVSGDERIVPSSSLQSGTVTAASSPLISQDSHEEATIHHARRIEDGGAPLHPVVSSHTFGSLSPNDPEEEVPPVPPLPQSTVHNYSSPGAASSTTFGSPQTPGEATFSTSAVVPSIEAGLQPWDRKVQPKTGEWPY